MFPLEAQKTFVQTGAVAYNGIQFRSANNVMARVKSNANTVIIIPCETFDFCNA